MSLQFRVFVAYVLLAAAFVALMTRLTLRDIRPQPLQATEDTLVETANLLAALLERELTARRSEPGSALDLGEFRATIEDALSRPLDAHIYDHAKRAMTLRVYVTDGHGIVLYDSANEAEGSDYSRWNDVFRTLRGDIRRAGHALRPAGPRSLPCITSARAVRVDGRLSESCRSASPSPASRTSSSAPTAGSRAIGLGVLLAAALLSVALAIW